MACVFGYNAHMKNIFPFSGSGRRSSGIINVGLACMVAVGVIISAHGVQQRYTPVPGGFATRNGDGEFNRPLYGWHGDDRELSPCKSLPWTSDRPKVALKVFRGYRIGNKRSLSTRTCDCCMRGSIRRASTTSRGLASRARSWRTAICD